MFIEVFIHIAHLDQLFDNKPVNCKINYASQYDMKVLLNPKKYVLVQSDNTNQNLIVVRKKRLKDYLKLNKLFK